MNNKIQNFKKGREGEEIARKFLVEKGFKLVESNYTNKLGELDLIMIYKDILIFVEVKMKVGDRFWMPEEMINKHKLSQVKRVAEGFLVMEQIAKSYQKYRIDAVCIVVDENKNVERINHYENVQL
jgi:putative endonuclease